MSNKNKEGNQKQKREAARARQALQIKKIVAPVDGSPDSQRSVQVAIRLARIYGAELVILHVIQSPTYYLYAPRAFGSPPVHEYLSYAEKGAKQWAQSILEEATANGVAARLEILKTKSSVISAIVENSIGEKADLIVIGTRGLGGFRKLLQGSVSSGVVAHAHCNVLVVR
jgi:nucleotide-binding universal stress UspA family protein